MTRFHAALAVLIILAMLCLVMMANVAFSSIAPTQQCFSVNTVKADLMRAIPGAVVVDLGGTEAQAFMTAFNAIPPVSRHSGDYIVTVTDEAYPNVLVVLFEKGCFSRMFPLPKPVFHSLMRTL